MYKNLNESINTERNKIQTESIKNELTILKKDTENTTKNNTNKTEENKKIIDIVEHILHFNEKNQQGNGLKILTQSQMLSRLSISLAQLNAGNNSEKLENEIRQLLNSLYRSKKLTKNIYKSLLDII